MPNLPTVLILLFGVCWSVYDTTEIHMNLNFRTGSWIECHGVYIYVQDRKRIEYFTSSSNTFFFGKINFEYYWERTGPDQVHRNCLREKEEENTIHYCRLSATARMNNNGLIRFRGVVVVWVSLSIIDDQRIKRIIVSLFDRDEIIPRSLFMIRGRRRIYYFIFFLFSSIP